MKIQPVVEGHGEVRAVPVLLRRLIEEAQAWEVRISRPIRRNRSQLVQRAELEKTVRLASLQQDCSGILILFDGDDDCPADLGPRVQQWATMVSGGVPCEVVMPHREYEAWFLAAIESLRGRRSIKPDADPHPAPETPRGAKEQLEARMFAGGGYIETTDQPAFSAQFSLPAAYSRCRSFQKLTKSFGVLLREAGRDIGIWPPVAWTESG